MAGCYGNDPEDKYFERRLLDHLDPTDCIYVCTLCCQEESHCNCEHTCDNCLELVCECDPEED